MLIITCNGFQIPAVDILQLSSIYPINNLLKKFPRECQLSREVHQLVNKLCVYGNCLALFLNTSIIHCKSTSHWHINSLSSYHVMVHTMQPSFPWLWKKILKLRTVAKIIRRESVYHDASLQLSQLHIIANNNSLQW